METKPNFVVGDDGKTYLELHDPADELQRALNPETGTEANSQVWEDVKPDVPAPPLLDLPSVWRHIADGAHIPTTSDDIQVSSVMDVNEQNAAILVRELKFYLLAVNTFDEPDEKETVAKTPVEEKGGEKTEAKRSTDTDTDINTKTEPGEEKGNEEQKGKNANTNGAGSKGAKSKEKKNENGNEKKEQKTKKSIYGSSILLKLRWDDRTPQKKVPKMDYTEVGNFVREVETNLKKANASNAGNTKPCFDAIALDMTPILFARLLDGIESGNMVLESACLDLLMLCTKHANPREMHMGILTFYRKIDVIYMQATSYFVYDPLVRVWAATILKIPRKRHAFLMEFIKVYEAMAKASEGWIFGNEGQVEDPNDELANYHLARCDNIPNLALDFYVGLAEVQSQHRKSSKNIRDKVDILGRSLPSFAMLEHMSLDDVGGGENETSTTTTTATVITDETDSQPQLDKDDPATAEAMDWVAERAVLLARSLQTQSIIWSKLPLPPGEDRNVPRNEKKNRRKQTAEQSKAEEDLVRVLTLLQKLGWTNGVLACQVGTTGLSLDLIRREHEAIGNHVGFDERRKKEMKNSRYSILCVGLFVCGLLRAKTRKMMEARRVKRDVNEGGDESNCVSTKSNSTPSKGVDTSVNVKKDGEEAEEYSVDLTNTGFDLLQPTYAFELTLPYLMALVGQSCIASKMAGMITLRAFFDQLPLEDGTWGKRFEFESLLEERCGTRSVGRDVSLFGLAQHLLRSVGMLDDPRHRRFAYETFKKVVKRYKHPLVRYSLLEAMFDRDVLGPKAVEGQIVTEMKDTVCLSDRIAWGDEETEKRNEFEWTRKKAIDLKTRFVQMVLPKYFMPRKEMLGATSVIVSVANACVYVAGSNVRHMEICKRALMGVDGEGQDKGIDATMKTKTESKKEDEHCKALRDAIEENVGWMKAMVKMGKECVRALGSAADYDRKEVPKSTLAKKSLKDAKQLYSVSGKALQQCVTALYALDMTVDSLNKVTPGR